MDSLFSCRRHLLVGSVLLLVLSLSIQQSSAGTSIGSGKQLGGQNSIVQTAESTERGGYGHYPTGYSFASSAASFGLPLVIIPLIYFGFLWCVLLFGLAVFNAPHHHGHHRPHGHHHRYRRYDDGYEDDYTTQQQVLSSI